MFFIGFASGFVIGGVGLLLIYRKNKKHMEGIITDLRTKLNIK